MGWGPVTEASLGNYGKGKLRAMAMTAGNVGIGRSTSYNAKTVRG